MTLIATDVEVHYATTIALHGVSLRVARGEVVALVGANGAGKSTMLQSLMGLVPYKRAAVTFEGQPVDKIVELAIEY